MLQCIYCERPVYRDRSLLNDNFLHLCVNEERRIYDYMKADGSACKTSGCTCRYDHRARFCNKCGHFNLPAMLNV